MFVCLFLTGSPAIFNFWGDSADQGVALFERRGRDSREPWVKQSLPHKRPAKLLLFFGLCKFFRYFYFVICIFSQFLCIFSFFVCISFVVPYKEQHFFECFCCSFKGETHWEYFQEQPFLPLVGLFLVHLNHILLIPFHGMKYTTFMRTRIVDPIEASKYHSRYDL